MGIVMGVKAGPRFNALVLGLVAFVGVAAIGWASYW